MERSLDMKGERTMKYVEPEMKVLELETEIICTSGILDPSKPIETPDL